MKLADSFAFPKNKDELLKYLVDLFGTMNRHFIPRNPSGGPTDEDVLIIWSCCVQRLEELGLSTIAPEDVLALEALAARRLQQHHLVKPVAWVAVSERLPEENIDVVLSWAGLAPIDRAAVQTGYYSEGRWYAFDCGSYERLARIVEPTHWLALPPGP
jgi:hypothetical protein